MASHDMRETNRNASLLKLSEVAKLGQSLGHWTIERSTSDDGDHWRFVDIVTPDGFHFCLTAGTWNKENKIGAAVGGVKIDDNVKAYPSDVMGCNEEKPSNAYIGANKPASTIVKDIMRRVINNPLCIEVAKRINARIESLKASRAGVSAHVETLKKLGFTFDKGSKNSTRVAEGWHSALKLYGVKVYDTGRVSFDVTLPVEKMAAVLALLGGAA